MLEDTAAASVPSTFFFQNGNIIFIVFLSTEMWFHLEEKRELQSDLPNVGGRPGHEILQSRWAFRLRPRPCTPCNTLRGGLVP